jgi:hypothetical protein
MDWSWVYATVARNVGWTYRKIGNQPACDIFALLDDLEAHPPSYLIDGWRHLPKPKPKRVLSDPAARESLSGMFGGMRKMPEHLRKLFGLDGANAPKKS